MHIPSVKVIGFPSSLVTCKTLTDVLQERWKERQSSLYTEKEKSDAREEIAEIVKQYSDDMVKRWKEEMDTLLVYVRDPVHS